MKIVLCWYFGYAVSSNLTFFAYTHGRLFRGVGEASPQLEWGRQWDCLPRICGICKHIEQIVLCLRLLLGNLQPSPIPIARFKWATRQGGEGSMVRRGRKKGKGRDRKRRSGLSPLKKISEGTHASSYYYIGL